MRAGLAQFLATAHGAAYRSYVNFNAMAPEPREKDTTIATLVRVRPDLLEVRYKPGCMLSTINLGEVAVARRDLMGRSPYGMFSVLPEDADFELKAMNVDHLAEDRRDGLMVAIALVAPANMIEMLLKLYFSYYPLLKRILVNDDEQQARAWIEAQLEEARTGS
jgi:hypothetical protein